MARRRRHLRIWQGLLAGAAIGFALWQAQAALSGWGKPEMVRGMNIAQFTRRAIASPPPLQDIRVHPPIDGKQLVTGSADVDGQIAAFEWLAPLPLVAPASSGASTRSFASVPEYLATIAPQLPYRFAWWEVPRTAAALWIGVPMLVLGALLPLAIELLMRAGIIARPPIEIEPPPVVHAPPEPPPLKPIVDHEAIDAQLRAATEDLEQRLANHVAGDASPQSIAEAAAAPTPFQSSANIADAPLPPPPKEQTSFEAGTYYPVHRPKRGE